MLFERSEPVPIRSQRVPQSIETPVTFVPAPGIYLRYAYSRSSDSMASGIDGQDYLCFQHNDQKFVFVICDGVGSSFCGNLAARILGDGLLEWLWSADVTYLGGASALSEAAASALNRLQKQAKYEVEEYEIPGHISGLVKQALEAQRAYGSEAVFAAMRIDHPSPMIPDGLISLCWMGDTQVHVIGEDGKEIEIGGKWENANRWSTTQGVRGHMGAWMRELSGVARIVAFSDGLNAHATRLFDYSDDKLDREIRAGARLPTSDDVSLIDVVTRTPQYEGYPDPEMPDLNMERPILEPIWNPTGADKFELRWNWPGEKNASFMIQEATNPALTDGKVMNVIAKGYEWKPEKSQPPGHYYYRIRAANRRGVLTPWSELRQTRVAYPPPPAPTLEVDDSGNMPALNWQAQGESLDYVLQESLDADFKDIKVVYTGRSGGWAIPPGYQPAVYHYRVRAVSDGGEGPWSTVREVHVTVPPPPIPFLTAASDPFSEGGSTYELRWQPTPGSVYYEIEETAGDEEPRVMHLDSTLYRVNGQKPGDYAYRVRACHNYGCSDWSNEQNIAVTEKPPADAPVLQKHEGEAEGSYEISWDAVLRAAEYEVELAEDDQFDSAHVFSTEETHFSTDPEDDEGVTFARVRGANRGGGGPWSAILRLAAAPPAPDWIETLAASDGRRIGVQWAEAAGDATYTLQASTGGTSSFRDIYHGKDARYEMLVGETISTLVFRVRAETDGVPGDWCTADPVMVGPALTAPSLGIPEIGGEGEASLRWSEVKGAGRYVLEISRNDLFGNPQRLEGPGLSAIFHPPSSGRFWFRVRAAQGEQLGPASNIVSIEAQRPTAPSLWPVDPVKPNTMFEIAWTAVPGGVYYELQGSATSAFEPDKSANTRVNHPSLKYAVPGRAAGRYYYRVRAVDAHGQASVWSNVLIVDVRE